MEQQSFTEIEELNKGIAARGLSLVMKEEGLTLTDGSSEIRGDFCRMIPRIRESNLGRELIVRAARGSRFTGTGQAVDVTAGLGEDSLLLAAAGFDVWMYELDPVIAALLRDAMRRAEEIDELRESVRRCHLTQGDSIAALRSMREAPDVVFLDPMFPERNKSALVKKKFQMLHQLERPCADEEELLGAALDAGPRRIVIKRPVKGGYLAGRKPDYSLMGKAVRIDCFVSPGKKSL